MLRIPIALSLLAIPNNNEGSMYMYKLELGDSSEITITIVDTITIPIVKLSRYYSFRVNTYILS